MDIKMIGDTQLKTTTNKLNKKKYKWKTGIGFLTFKIFNCRRNLTITATSTKWTNLLC